MKVALGIIIRSLESEVELMNFVENAKKFNHKIDCVIVAYTFRINPIAVSKLSEKIPLVAININDLNFSKQQFRRLGISSKTTKTLLQCPIDTSKGLVPYGFNRNTIVIEAILREIDVLFFVDYDVYPVLLMQSAQGNILEETDFFGAHLKYLKSGSKVTTGEYSGYNILPPAVFEGMDDVLVGVQKSEMLDYWKHSDEHRCLMFQRANRVAVPCAKILGGNCAITLSAFSVLPPFFSSFHTVDGNVFLNRGEDTVFGLGIKKGKVVCTDIGLNPLHDTYKTFPNEPDIVNDNAVQERFYYACTGWVGRNPSLNYILGNDLKTTREYQREKLLLGLEELAKYTSNPKFKTIINNFDDSWNSLNRYIAEYEQMMEAWSEFTKKVGLKG